MAKKTKKMTYKEMLNDLETSYEYQLEIDEIRKANHFDEKEDFIQKCKELQKEDAFLDEFLNNFAHLLEKVVEVDMEDTFNSFLVEHGVETNSLSYYYYMQIEKNEEYATVFYEQSYDYDTYRTTICDIPWSVDMFYLMKEMKEFSKTVEEKLYFIKKREEERKLLEQKQKEKEEYSLYLKLKEKYENAEELDTEALDR